MSIKGPLLIPGGGIVPVYAPIKGLPQSVFSDALRQVFARVTVRCMLPEALRPEMEGYLTGDVLTDKEKQLLKAADRLSALIKCGEEVRAGNGEFRAALAQQQAALEAMACPAADYFMAHMLPCYALTLDELK